MGLWDNNEEEFRDIPDEAGLDSNGQPRQAPPAQVRMQTNPIPPRPTDRPSNIPAEPEPTYADIAPSVGLGNIADDIDLEDIEEDFTEVLNDANLRIEQGRLYQMIMNHSLFEGMDCDERAVKNVEKEIRKFARERMEVMLGMRQEKMMKDYANFNAQLASPFNDLEVEILKKIASKATNGATESPEANKVAETIREAPKRQTLNPISGSAPRRATPKPVQPNTRLQTRQAPLQRKRNDATVEQILAEEGVTREELEATFSDNYRPLEKPLHQLSEQEKLKRAKETAQRLARHTTVKSSSALPMATPEQQELLAIQRATQIGQAPGMALILEKVKSMPVKNTD